MRQLGRHRVVTVACLSAMMLVGAHGVSANECADMKNRATAKAFACVVKANNNLLGGHAGDVSKCADKLSLAVEIAEEKYFCGFPGESPDAAALQQRVAAVEAAVLAELGSPATDAERACVIGKNTATARYVTCVAKILKVILRGKAIKGGSAAAFEACAVKMDAAFFKAEAKAGGACLTANDARDLRVLAVPAGTNLARAEIRGADLVEAVLSGADLSRTDLHLASFTGADLRGADLFLADGTASDFSGANLTGASLVGTDLFDADLTGADLSGATLDSVNGIYLQGCPATLPGTWLCVHASPSFPYGSAYLVGPGADLSNADLTDADMTGADLDGVGWRSTRCPDGSDSESNGSNPESCCAHLDGATPLTCSP